MKTGRLLIGECTGVGVAVTFWLLKLLGNDSQCGLLISVVQDSGWAGGTSGFVITHGGAEVGGFEWLGLVLVIAEWGVSGVKSVVSIMAAIATVNCCMVLQSC